MWLEPVAQRGEVVELLPLEEGHASGLWQANADTEVWTWMPFRIGSEGEMRGFIQKARGMNERDLGLGFAIRDVASEELIGSTGYWNPDPAHRRVEIGATWVTKRFQRTAVNTECKLLLLRHAFESLVCNRVEFKTDATNQRSRVALERIGASEEGTLRQHMLLPSGRWRDSVYYSVLASEWPSVEARLRDFLAPQGPTP